MGRHAQCLPGSFISNMIQVAMHYSERFVNNAGYGHFHTSRMKMPMDIGSANYNIPQSAVRIFGVTPP